MEYIGRNNELIQRFSGDLTLLSSKLHKIDIHDDLGKGLVIELYIELLYAKANKFIKLVFWGIEEYLLYYNHAHDFYNIESYKFLNAGNRYYICLDPYLAGDGLISEEDQDFILSAEVEGYFL